MVDNIILAQIDAVLNKWMSPFHYPTSSRAKRGISLQWQRFLISAIFFIDARLNIFLNNIKKHLKNYVVMIKSPQLKTLMKQDLGLQVKHNGYMWHRLKLQLIIMYRQDVNHCSMVFQAL